MNVAPVARVTVLLGLLLLWPVGWPAAQTAAQYQVPPVAALADPTRLTSEQLFREIATLEKTINYQIINIVKSADEFKSSLTHFPNEVDQKISQMEKLQAALNRELQTKTDERFAGISLQFKERDERVLQLAAGTKVAVDLALSAQKEQVVAQNLNITGALNEIKTTFGKLIDNQQQLQVNNTKALEDRISAVKDQVTAITGRTSGAGDSWVLFVAVAGMAIGVGGLVINFNRNRPTVGAQATPQVVYIPTPATLPTAPISPPATHSI